MAKYYDPECDRFVTEDTIIEQHRKLKESSPYAREYEDFKRINFFPAELIEEDGIKYWKLETGKCLPYTYSA